jgi:hypothetical protein
VRVENEGVEAVLSFYLYGLIGLSLLVVISPLIVVAVPVLVILGPVCFRWWVGRRRSPRIGGVARWWLVLASTLLLSAPVVPAIWYLLDNETGAPKESFWLLVIAVGVVPFPMAAVAYVVRSGSKTDTP